MYNTKRFLFLLFLGSIANSIFGQGTGNSPLSQYGIGEITTELGNVRNLGMGNVGVSTRHHFYVNYLNPALLANLRNPKKLRTNHKYLAYDHFINQRIDTTVKLDFALMYQSITAQTSNQFDNSHGINLAYFAFCFPISKVWGSSIGVRPFSTVNYTYESSTPVLNNSNVYVENSSSGKGGIYKLFWGNGFGISKNISVGLETAYLFGNINNEYLTKINDFSTKAFGFHRQNHYSLFEAKPGILFRKEIIKSYKDSVMVEDSLKNQTFGLIRKTKSSGVFYNIGLTYDFYSKVNIERSVNQYIIESNNQIIKDSTIESTSYKATFPPSFRLGVSIDKPMKWTIAADIYYAAWSIYQPSFMVEKLGDSYGFSVGGELTPGQLKLRSKTYRLGFNYIKTPYYMNTIQADDISVSIGGSVPFGRRSLTSPILPRVNVAIIAGQRGNIVTNGYMEQYIKVNLSLLINEKWFNKRKIY